jgi:ankyrin repeat protein
MYIPVKRKKFIKAIRNNNIDEVKSLIAQGVDVNAVYSYKETALDIAISGFSYDLAGTIISDRTEIASALLDAGFDVSEPRGQQYLSFAYWHGRTGIASLLVSHGVEANDYPVNPDLAKHERFHILQRTPEGRDILYSEGILNFKVLH